MSYSSNLTDREWEIIEPLLPRKKKTNPGKWTKREIFDGVLYQLKNGCNWQDLPKDFPPYSTVYWHYKQWRSEGVIQTIMTTLHGKVREQVNKKQKWTTLIMIDSQAVKNTCNASKESKGFCFYILYNAVPVKGINCTSFSKKILLIRPFTSFFKGNPFVIYCSNQTIHSFRVLRFGKCRNTKNPDLREGDRSLKFGTRGDRAHLILT
jgi:transposase